MGKPQLRLCGYYKGAALRRPQLPRTIGTQSSLPMPSPVSQPGIREARFEAPVHPGQLFRS
jgi:acyl dehydratase